jgi:hypothetical protein
MIEFGLSIPTCAPAHRAFGVKLKVDDFVGSVERLAWAKENGCRWGNSRGALVGVWRDSRIYRLIARGGQLDVLKWAREHGCPLWGGATAT